MSRAAAVRIGTRGSALALAQAALVAGALEAAGRRSRVVVVETAGDRRAPDTAWGEGAFVAAIEADLLAGTVDLAVHSAKDLPTDAEPRLAIGAYLPRADPRDVLVLRAGAAPGGLADLAAGSIVGTDSPRRAGFVLASRPDLVVRPLHGNVDTRLRRLDEGRADALVLAAAGLDRLGRADRIAERLDPAVVPPAAGQGAIAVQVRADDRRLRRLLAAIDDRPTRLAVEAERAFLAASGGGCRAPIGALADITGDHLAMTGGYARPDGTAVAWDHVEGPADDGARLGALLAAHLGARLPGVPAMGDAPRRRVIVTRAAGQADGLVEALSGLGLEAALVPAIAIEPVVRGNGLAAAAAHLDQYAWVVVTSLNGVRALLAADPAARTPRHASRPRWAAVGAATAAALETAGIAVDLRPAEASADGLAAELPVGPGERVLLVRGDLADETLPTALRARGAEVDAVVAYHTREAPASSHAALRAAVAAGPPAAVVFTSGSTVRGLTTLAAADPAVEVTGIPAVCIGPQTAREARRLGFTLVGEASSRDTAALAAAVSRATATPPAVPPAPLPTLITRTRRLRRTAALRALVRETRLDPAMLVAPLFVRPGHGLREPIEALPGQARLSPDLAAIEAARLAALGVGGVLLFGLPEAKDPLGLGASDDGGVVQDALRRMRALDLPLVLMADTCLCEYTDHGHCGPLAADGSVDNDAALARLAETALSQARAGAEVVAPSAMMDGQVAAIRTALDAAGLSQTAIMAYAAKHASAFYGPFREAAGSAPAFGDRQGYQMDPANGREADREMALDVEEGADILLVKPALPALDLVAAARARFDLPLAAYQVSGEYAMLAAAAERGWLDGRRAMLEALTAIVRAGAGIVITYAAGDVATWLQETR